MTAAGGDRPGGAGGGGDSLLVTGGARSGKTRLAQEWIEAGDGPRWYLATAQARDDEMRDRVRRHQAMRGAAWAGTCEEPLQVVPALLRLAEAGAGGVVVDCVTLWLSNLGERDGWDADALLAEVEALAAVLADPPCAIAVVTNEVGAGIVPANALARAFRDLQGWANQRLARGARRVAFVACGLPCWLKGAP